MWRRRGIADERNTVRGLRAQRRRRRHDGGGRGGAGSDAVLEGIDLFQFFLTQTNCSDVSPRGPTRQDATVKSATILHSPTGPTRQS